MAKWCPSSAKVTLYEKECFGGCYYTITQDMPCLGPLDNCVSSAIVHEGDWALYSEVKYSGKRMILCEGQSYCRLPGMDNAASSICKI